MVQIKTNWMKLWISDTEKVFICFQVNIYYEGQTIFAMNFGLLYNKKNA